MTVPHWIPPFTAIALLLGGTVAFAQGASAEEVVDGNGAVSPSLALTQAQKTAIYNAVQRQRIKPSAGALVEPTIGTPVPPTVPLSALPDGAAEAPGQDALKYAMVADEVVVIDPLTMRVVEVIHGGMRP